MRRLSCAEYILVMCSLCSEDWAKNPCTYHRNDIRGSSSSAASLSLARHNSDQCGIIIGNNNSSGQSPADEEKSKSDIDRLESALDVYAGSLCFRGHH